MTLLNPNQQHVLRLTEKGKDKTGWAKVSKPIWRFVEEVPDELLEKNPNGEGGTVRLTDKGRLILKYLVAT